MLLQIERKREGDRLVSKLFYWEIIIVEDTKCPAHQQIELNGTKNFEKKKKMERNDKNLCETGEFVFLFFVL